MLENVIKKVQILKFFYSLILIKNVLKTPAHLNNNYLLYKYLNSKFSEIGEGIHMYLSVIHDIVFQ